MRRDGFDDFDKDFNRVRNFAYGWFIFVALLTVALFVGIGFMVFKVLAYFGIL